MDIVERLRERTALRYMGNCKCGSCQLVPRADVDEAAATITALRARVAELEGALEPFAKLEFDALISADPATGWCAIRDNVPPVDFTTGDILRARAALRAKGGEHADA